ncbi:MAG: class I SAM-dependent DNA methyltransferase, partial [Porphyrobacter sp.]|nr:class I SAM-dependent DNA methyltransferase [Porphyrobacter sp.]
MRLGWDEIRRRAKAFSEEWKDARYEKGDTQTFYNEFFEIFGIRRKQVAVYEQRVKLLSNRHGFIDLFWPGTLLVEQKSGRLDLGKAQGQALDYVEGIHPTLQPRWVLTCDFQNWVLLDLETGAQLTFPLADLHKHITAFDFMLGRKVSFETQAGVTIKAAELMGKLHDALEESGYVGHDLEQLLVRLLFCLFADDTGIFQPKDIFLQLVENDTRPDGSDTGRVLNDLFDVLDTPEDARQSTLQGELNAFPYVNGRLFAGRLRTPHFTAAMREHLLDAARHDWSGVSPAIFGSLFQSVMDAKERRAKGAHYTSEENIMKVIGPLFLDDLKAELAGIVARKTGRDKALAEFQHKLTRLTFFDPACGCGNFLVIAYREIRRLELQALRAQYGGQQIDAALLARVTVDQFHGIELEEFPARIAEVAMWMMDHIANNEINEAFRLNYARIPLKDSAHILPGDALEVDWGELLPPERCSYIMGNPPFIGHQWRTPEQQAGMHRVWGRSGQVNRLDYVTAWFKKALNYSTTNHSIRIAFVATNSITQGEQAGILWPILLRSGFEINFAHRTFVWANEASGNAAVHVVIIGLAHGKAQKPVIFDYTNPRGDCFAVSVSRINGYLIDGPFITLPARTTAPAGLPKMLKGSQPTDGARLKGPDGKYVTTSNLILDARERSRALARDPSIAKWLKPYVGGDELISGDWRWCLWIKDASPKELRASAEIKERLERVR